MGDVWSKCVIESDNSCFFNPVIVNQTGETRSATFARITPFCRAGVRLDTWICAGVSPAVWMEGSGMRMGLRPRAGVVEVAWMGGACQSTPPGKVAR